MNINHAGHHTKEKPQRMKLEIDEKHFHVFHLLLLLLAWANTCYILVIFLKDILPVMLTSILVLTGTLLTLLMVFITILITIRWINHHRLGLWLLIGLISLFVLSWALESTIRGIFLKEQAYDNEQTF
ncbi:hypothetical protein ACFL52_01995 [Candidatus Margulisiibacteriota bacterium]